MAKRMIPFVRLKCFIIDMGKRTATIENGTWFRGIRSLPRVKVATVSGTNSTSSIIGGAGVSYFLVVEQSLALHT